MGRKTWVSNVVGVSCRDRTDLELLVSCTREGGDGTPGSGEKTFGQARGPLHESGSIRSKAFLICLTDSTV